ncbi:MAG: hypothetical protein KDE53_35750, partial [Caldilineaceae bacterium]|nr:hypothetical protein [Caldilineaceae bacterium]
SSTLVFPAEQEEAATPAAPTSVARNKVAMAAEPVSRTRQSGNRAIYGTYQITYASAALIREVPVKAYIEVNEHEFAAIQFLNSTTISSRRCVSSGRFDLCPI